MAETVLCQTSLWSVLIAELILELHTNVPAGCSREGNHPCCQIINEPDAQ